MSFDIGTKLEESLHTVRETFLPTPIVRVPLEAVTLWVDVWAGTPDLAPHEVALYVSLALADETLLVPVEQWDVVVCTADDEVSPTPGPYLYTRVYRVPRAALVGMRVHAVDYQPLPPPKRRRRN